MHSKRHSNFWLQDIVNQENSRSQAEMQYARKTGQHWLQQYVKNAEL